MDVSTVIVSYNTFDYTRNAVRTSLRSADGLTHEVVVVDNASPDRSAERLREEFDGEASVCVLDSGGNVGFSAANNLGARHASGRVLHFLNPDTLVHDAATTRLVRFLDAHPEVGAAGPLVLNADGSVQPSVIAFPTPRELLRHYLPLGDAIRLRDRRTDPMPTQTQCVDAVKGCALAIRRDAFNAIGGWDESTFMYTEEVEMCWRLREHGMTTVFLPEAVVTHFGGVASRERYTEQQVLERQSVLHFLRRRGSRGTIVANRIGGILGFGGRAVLFAALARLRPGQSGDYVLRGEAARTLFRWFALDYS